MEMLLEKGELKVLECGFEALGAPGRGEGGDELGEDGEDC